MTALRSWPGRWPRCVAAATGPPGCFTPADLADFSQKTEETFHEAYMTHTSTSPNYHKRDEDLLAGRTGFEPAWRQGVLPAGRALAGVRPARSALTRQSRAAAAWS
jgi:hypothetical protein